MFVSGYSGGSEVKGSLLACCCAFVCFLFGVCMCARARVCVCVCVCVRARARAACNVARAHHRLLTVWRMVLMSF